MRAAEEAAAAGVRGVRCTSAQCGTSLLCCTSSSWWQGMQRRTQQGPLGQAEGGGSRQ